MLHEWELIRVYMHAAAHTFLPYTLFPRTLGSCYTQSWIKIRCWSGLLHNTSPHTSVSYFSQRESSAMRSKHVIRNYAQAVSCRVNTSSGNKGLRLGADLGCCITLCHTLQSVITSCHSGISVRSHSQRSLTWPPLLSSRSAPCIAVASVAKVWYPLKVYKLLEPLQSQLHYY